MIRLKELRESRNVSRKQLAEHLKIAQNTLSYWESGKYEPDLKSVLFIASYFNVSTDYLLGNSEVEDTLIGFSNNAFKDILKSLRIRNNITQEQLAGKLGISRTAVSKWESGKNGPTSDMMIKISNLFGVSIDYLCSNDSTEQTMRNSFKSILKSLRKERNVTQEQLAVILGVDRSSIGKYESSPEGKEVIPSVDVLHKIADYFDVSLDYLLGRNNANSSFDIIKDQTSSVYRFKQLREEHGFSQQYVANHLNLSQQAWANYESGKREPSIKILKEVASFFDISLDYLLGETEIKNTAESNKNNTPSEAFELQNIVRSISLDQVREVKAFLSLSDEQRKAILVLAKIDLDDKE